MNRLSPERGQQIARQTRMMFLIVEAVAIIITCCALADVLFGLGWGYDWKAVLIGIGICLWGVLVWAACRIVFRLFGVKP
jgi:hypothetical protein